MIFTNMYANLGGGEFALFEHIKATKDRDCSVSVILLESGPFCELLRTINVPYYIIPFSWKGNKVLSLLAIAKVLALFFIRILIEKPILIVSYTFNDFFFSAIVAKCLSLPCVYRSQGEIFPDGCINNSTWLGKYFVSFANLTKASVICTTKREYDAYNKSGVKSELLSYIYLGVKDFYYGKFVEYRLVHKKPVIGMFGRLVEWKGHKVFLDALGILKKNNVLFSVMIVGSADFGDGERYYKALCDLVISNNIEEEVSFTGFRDDVNLLMQQCDLICHCSSFEPFGLVIIEAMMAGRAVIATSVSGPSEIVINGDNGILIEPNNPQLLAHNIKDLVLNKQNIENLANKGRERAVNCFDLTTNMNKLINFCEDKMG